jgi:Tol biopolymer transport system component
VNDNLPPPGDLVVQPDPDRLESWKEIATYLGRSVTAVQRWEQEEGLPVRRELHKKRGSVFSRKSELDAWRRERSVLASSSVDRQESPAAEPPAPARPLRPYVLLGAGALGVAAALGSLVLWYSASSDAAVPGPVVPRPLANQGSENSPSLSPDGTQVVYDWVVNGRHRIYIKPVAGGTERQLDTGSDLRFRESAYPSWSPRGDLIAFLAHDREQGFGLHVISPDGGHLRRLTSMAGIGHCWHPGGDLIGFADRNAAGEPFSIYSVSLVTGERRRLTEPPATAFGDTYCAFSASGRELAVIRHSTRSASAIHIVDLAQPLTAEARRLTTGQSGMRGLAWTPDGSAIVAGSANGVWRFDVSGTSRAPTLVTAAEGTTQHPSFSRPDADGIASFVYEYNVHDVNLWRWHRDPDGTDDLHSISGSIVWEDQPAISPDGRRLAFVSNRGGPVAIWTSDRDGGSPRQVTFHGPLSVSPQWSPSGDRLAFASEIDGNWDLYSVRVDGSNSRRLTWEPSQEENPTWSRDGRWIYFKSDRSGEGRIWRLSVDNGHAEPVTSGPGSQAFESPDGSTLYFVRSDNSRGLWSMPVGGGPEVLVQPDIEEKRFGLTDTGVMFMTMIPKKPSLRFFDPVSKAVTLIAELPDAERWAGFAVTPDGRTVLWPQTDTNLTYLMLVERWRGAR